MCQTTFWNSKAFVQSSTTWTTGTYYCRLTYGVTRSGSTNLRHVNPLDFSQTFIRDQTWAPDTSGHINSHEILTSLPLNMMVRIYYWTFRLWVVGFLVRKTNIFIQIAVQQTLKQTASGAFFKGELLILYCVSSFAILIVMCVIIFQEELVNTKDWIFHICLQQSRFVLCCAFLKEKLIFSPFRSFMTEKRNNLSVSFNFNCVFNFISILIA